MRILFITTHNLATNPRLVKEIQLALNVGHEVEVICFEFQNWSYSIDQSLRIFFQNLGVVFYTIQAGRKPFNSWFLSFFLEKISRWSSTLFKLNLWGLAQAMSRRNSLLINCLQKVRHPNLVVGHNLGSLLATLIGANKFKCSAGFDVEDYHPGEGYDLNMHSLARKLMKSTLPKMDYVSFASPLIMQAVKKDLKRDILNSLTILNYFPAEEFKVPSTINYGPVKLVWFSQNINSGRGLELILPFVQQEIGNIELHLIGNLNSVFYETELNGIQNIFIHSSMSQKSLHQQLGDFDIGLALEPAKDENNELAISNKILAYLQAGLFVVATNTKAQESFLGELPNHGICFDYKINDSAIVLNKVISEIETIRFKKNIRFNDFKIHNWEYESLNLINEWNK